MSSFITRAVLIPAASLALAACATPEPYYAGPYYPGYPVYGATAAAPPVAVARSELGVVESIDLVRDGASTSGLGAVLGGIAGGVVGHQFGSGRGNTAATIAGAIGGAVVGNEVERARPNDRYRIIVRLDSGAAIGFAEVGEGQLRVGDRVRVVNGRVYRV